MSLDSGSPWPLSSDDHFSALAQQLWSAPELSPRPFGPFRLIHLLGIGSFGVVWLAEDSRLSRRVALKIPHAAMLYSPQSRARFLREAKAAALLDHPNLVPLFEVGEVEGACYLASAYIAGPTLQRWLNERGGVVGVAIAVELLIALADAMEHAHRRGVLHCDLKPANIILQSSAEVAHPVPRITDFGLARLLDDDPDATGSHLIAGTPLYMSPEQARGNRRELDHATDIYALGTILYELLTGRVPIVGENEIEIIKRLQEDEPLPPNRVRRSVPADLGAVCMRCLEKNPARRYASCLELRQDLVRFQQGKPTLARPVPWWRKTYHELRRRPTLLTSLSSGLVALVIVVALSMSYSRSLGLADGERLVAQRESLAAKELAQTNEFHSLISAARERLNSSQPGWTLQNRQDLARADQLATTAQQHSQVRSLLAATLLAVDVGTPSVLGKGINPHAMGFHPKGDRLALGAYFINLFTPSVWLVDPATSRVEQQFMVPINKCSGHHSGRKDGVRALAFTPDGRWLVIGARSGWLHFWDLSQPKPAIRSWQPHPNEIVHIAFSPDGTRLYVNDDPTSREAGSISCWVWPPKQGKNPDLVHRNDTLAPISESVAIDPKGRWVLLPRQSLQFCDRDLKPLPERTIIHDIGLAQCSPDGEILTVSWGTDFRFFDSRTSSSGRDLARAVWSNYTMNRLPLSDSTRRVLGSGLPRALTAAFDFGTVGAANCCWICRKREGRR